MENFLENRVTLESQPKDAVPTWLNQKQCYDKEPWLFYGEDEDFINAE